MNKNKKLIEKLNLGGGVTLPDLSIPNLSMPGLNLPNFGDINNLCSCNLSIWSSICCFMMLGCVFMIILIKK